MEMTIPLYVLAVALPMFVLTRLSKRVFFQLHSKCKVGSFRRIYCSFPVSVNNCFASEPYSLPMVSLEILQSGWFHECISTRRNNQGVGGGGGVLYTWQNSHRRQFHIGVTFWFCIAFTWWWVISYLGLFVGTLHVDKIPVRNGWSFRVYMIPLRNFVPVWNSRPGTTAGVNSRRSDSRRHDIVYHVNKYRAMRGNRSELTLAPRCHVNTP